MKNNINKKIFIVAAIFFVIILAVFISMIRSKMMNARNIAFREIEQQGNNHLNTDFYGLTGKLLFSRCNELYVFDFHHNNEKKLLAYNPPNGKYWLSHIVISEWINDGKHIFITIEGADGKDDENPLFSNYFVDENGINLKHISDDWPDFKRFDHKINVLPSTKMGEMFRFDGSRFALEKKVPVEVKTDYSGRYKSHNGKEYVQYEFNEGRLELSNGQVVYQEDPNDMYHISIGSIMWSFDDEYLSFTLERIRTIESTNDATVKSRKSHAIQDNKICVFHTSTKELRCAEIMKDDDGYIPNLKWAPNNDVILLIYSPEKGAQKLLRYNIKLNSIETLYQAEGFGWPIFIRNDIVSFVCVDQEMINTNIRHIDLWSKEGCAFVKQKELYKIFIMNLKTKQIRAVTHGYGFTEYSYKE